MSDHTGLWWWRGSCHTDHSHLELLRWGLDAYKRCAELLQPAPRAAERAQPAEKVWQGTTRQLCCP